MTHMTKKEVVNLLVNSRVYVDVYSEKIQRLALKVGFRWGKDPKDEVKFLDKPFLFFSCKDGKLYIKYSSDVTKFNNSSKKLLNAQTLADIEVMQSRDYIAGYRDGYAQGWDDCEDGEEYNDEQY